MKYRALVFLSFFRKNDFVIFQLGFDIAERVQVFHDLRYIGIAVGNEVKTIAHQGVIADLNAHIIPSADFLHFPWKNSKQMYQAKLLLDCLVSTCYQESQNKNNRLSTECNTPYRHRLR